MGHLSDQNVILKEKHQSVWNEVFCFLFNKYNDQKKRRIHGAQKGHKKESFMDYFNFDKAG